MTKQRRRTSGWLAQHALAFAGRGNPFPLIARLLFLLRHGGTPLSRDEINFIVAALEATAGKKIKADLRRLEKELIALRIEGLVTEEGMLQKEAIGIVEDERKRSVRHIKEAITTQKKLVSEKQGIDQTLAKRKPAHKQRRRNKPPAGG